MDDSAVINKEFGSWKVIERDAKATKTYKRITYKCRCKCGNEQLVSYHDLKTGRSKACKKCATSGTNNHAFVDKSGMVVGDFKILQYDHNENSMSYWLCKNIITGKLEVKSDNNIQVIKSRIRKRSEQLKAMGLEGYDDYLQYIDRFSKKPKAKIPFTFVNQNDAN